MNIRTALAAILILNGLAIGNLLFAADDPQQTIAALQGMLAREQQCRDGLAAVLQLQGQAQQREAEIAALRKEIEALKKVKEPAK